MNFLTEPVAKTAPSANIVASATDWLEALTRGECDQRSFLEGVDQTLQRAPETGWDLLSLADQYYRLGRISEAAFNAIKSHLQNLLVGIQGRPAQGRPAQGRPAQGRPAQGRPADLPSPVQTKAQQAPPALRHDLASRTSADMAKSEPRPRSLGAGDILKNRYRIEGLLGRGGMGTVYAAIDQYRLSDAHSDEHIAIKVLHTEVLARPRLFDELRREFQNLQALSHPHIVRVHEFDRDGDLAFFTMECLRGALLAEVIPVPSTGGLQRPHALAIIRDVGAAIAYAHSRGVVHGDLNPANVYVTDDGDVKVLDFGASEFLREKHLAQWAERDVPVATPAFASCQVLEGATAEARDDVYALACIAYMLLTGQLPYGEHTSLQARTLRLTPARPRALRARQWRSLRSGLSFERDQRPEDVRGWLIDLDLRQAAPRLPELKALLPRIRQRAGMTRRLAAAVVVAAAALGAGWWATMHRDSVAELFGVGAHDRFTLTPPTITADTDRHVRPATSSQAMVSPSPTTPVVADPVTPPHGSFVSPARAETPAPAAAPATAAAPLQARVELAADTVDVDPDQAVARVLVRRSRTLRGDVDFKWWTESGTARPGRDFKAINARTAQIDSGKNGAELTIPVEIDPLRQGPRSFYVVIDEPSDNAMLGARTVAMVTIPGPSP